MQSVNTEQQVQTASLKRTRGKIAAIIILLFLAFVGMMLLVAFILFPYIKVLSGAAATAPPLTASVLSDSVSVSSGHEYVSPSVAFDQPFSSAALSWEQDNTEIELGVFLRSSSDGISWSEWYETALFYKNPPTMYSEMTVFPASSQYIQVRAMVEDTNSGAEVRIQNIHISTFPDPLRRSFSEASPKISLISSLAKYVLNIFPVFQALAQTVPADIKIISRAEWGANEDWRFCTSWDSAKSTCGTKSTNPKWPSEIVPVKKFVIHHTGRSNGSNIDPKEAVRNIYLWHAIVVEGGWGDIGYNYLVDQEGNVYEGRYGGDGVQAGHTFYGPYCKRIGTAGQTSAPCGVASGDVEVGYQMNAGSVGIAVLGNFDVEQANEKVKTAIAKLISMKSVTHGLDVTKTDDWPVPLKVKYPDGMESGIVESAIRDSGTLLSGKNLSFDFNFADPAKPLAVLHNLPNIISHRDVDRTSCPGDNFYSQLEDIRRLAINPTTEFEAVFDSSTLPVAMYVTKAASGEVKMRNTGSRSWLKSDVELRIFDDGRKVSLFRDGPWNDPAGKFSFTETEVKPQGIATFKVPLKAPQYAGTYKHDFALFKTSDGTEIFGSAFDRLTRVDETHQGQFISSSLPVAVKTIWRPTLKVTFKNAGFASWSRNTKLEIWDRSGAPSAFASKTWKGAVAATSGVLTKSGQNVTFTVKLLPPKTPGTYRQIFKLKDGNKEIWLGQSEVSIGTRVDQ